MEILFNVSLGFAAFTKAECRLKECLMEYITCTRCGQTLPRSKLERMKTGTYRRVCNHCKWLYYVKPSRDRRILRELAARKNH